MTAFRAAGTTDARQDEEGPRVPGHLCPVPAPVWEFRSPELCPNRCVISQAPGLQKSASTQRDDCLPLPSPGAPGRVQVRAASVSRGPSLLLQPALPPGHPGLSCPAPTQWPAGNWGAPACSSFCPQCGPHLSISAGLGSSEIPPARPVLSLPREAWPRTAAISECVVTGRTGLAWRRPHFLTVTFSSGEAG